MCGLKGKLVFLYRRVNRSDRTFSRTRTNMYDNENKKVFRVVKQLYLFKPVFKNVKKDPAHLFGFFLLFLKKEREVAV